MPAISFPPRIGLTSTKNFTPKVKYHIGMVETLDDYLSVDRKGSKMTGRLIEPPYNRPFSEKDFLGYFRWTEILSTKLRQDYLYHACHEDQLWEILEDEKLNLYSKCKLILPRYGEREIPGVWTGLNEFYLSNYYGPFLIRFPLSVLNGRNFMVFYRDEDRPRLSFVQYEARIPIYRYRGNVWRKVTSESLFSKSSGRLILKNHAIYDILLTEEVDMYDASIRPEAHQTKCIGRRCRGMSRSESRKVLKTIASYEFCYWLSQNRGYERLYKRFSVLNGVNVTLDNPNRMNPYPIE